MPALPPASAVPRARARRTALGAVGALVLTGATLAVPVSSQAAVPQPARTTAVVAVAAASSTPPKVKPGMTHRSIKRLQRLLGVHPRSGWYGPLTRAAAVAFKRSHGLGSEPAFGKRAWRALLKERAKADSRSARPASRSGSRGGMVCPAPRAHYSNDYGDPRYGHSHAGIDMLGKRGMPLYAVENGYVVRAGKQSDGANRIVIQGTQTGAKYYYGHNSRHLVSAGERFKAGEVIALMGDSGSPGINHLHFEWWRSGGESDYVNPYPLLERLC